MLNPSESKNDAKMRAFALKHGVFDSKKSAFDYFFIYEGKTASEARELAEEIAEARGVPDHPEPPKSTVDNIKDWIKQGRSLAKENPEIAEFLIGLVSGAATTAFGVKIGSSIESSGPVNHDIDKSGEVKELE